MDVKSEFKQTGLRVFPKDWEEQRLSSLVVTGPKNGYSGRSSKGARGTPTLSLGATTSGTLVLNDDTVKHLEETIDPNSELFLQSGDVLVQRSNTLDLVGTTAVFEGPSGVYAYPDLMMRIRFRENATAHWFWRYANSANGRRFFMTVAAGSSGSMPKISGHTLQQMRVPIPPLFERRAIAAALNDVDALLGGLDQLIAKKRDLKQAAMQHLLTGKTRLPGFCGEWQVKRLGSLLAYERPDCYIVKSTEYADHGDVPVLTANKSFILGYTTETFGMCTDLPAIVFDDFTTDSKFTTVPFKVKSSAIKLLRPRHERTSLRFLFERMQLIRFPVADHRRYYISDYQNMRLPIPECDEQLAVVAVFSDMDAEIAALEARRDKTKALKQAMMQELLIGKTRLVKPETAHA